MESIGIRELRQHASRWLRRVEAGESFEVTDRGRPIATLAPLRESDTPLDRLISSGEVSPPSAPRSAVHRVQLSAEERTASEVLIELRADAGRQVQYLDTSALVKLVFDEPESSVLDAFVGANQVATSALSRTELRRVALRINAAYLPICEELLASCYEIALTPGVLDQAGVIQPATLRSPDAIHLICARSLGDQLSTFVAYDDRLLDAALAAGLPVAVPR